MTDPTTVDTRKTIGRYEIRECIGRGGMGALFRGYDPVLERDVAIKTMLADFSGDDAGRTRFFREARAVARLQHRNIVTLFDFGEEDNTPYIVMEFLHGETLAQRMKTRNGGRVPIDRVLDIGAQLCTGLHFAHARGVVHRDVKPPNIWLNEDGSVKVLDFGIAKFGDTAVTRVGGVVGSVSYMSPEQISGSDVDGRSDIFSVGIVMYELLSGTRPFTGESPTAIMMRIMHEPPLPLDAPGAPPQLVALIERALQKDRSRRFQQAGELAADLRALQFTLTGPHRGASVPDHLVTTAPVSPGAGGSAIAAGGVGAAVVPSASLTRNAPGEWAMGSSEDLVADVVLHTPSSEANAAAAAAAASASAVVHEPMVARRARSAGRSAGQRLPWLAAPSRSPPSSSYC
jgi:serine/threonine protein kinase